MTTPLEIHENCGGKLVHPTAFYKNEKNKTVSEKTGDYFWCIRCKKIVQVEIKQK